MHSNLIQNLKKNKNKVAVIGLGYVGLPVAVAFSKQFTVIGYDRDDEKVEEYKNGYDVTNEIGDDNLKAASVQFTSDATELRNASIYIVIVPTPVTANNVPDLSFLEDACQTVGSAMNKGSVVIFESTVYPGVTEDYCIPLLEKYSNMKCKIDFFVAYSPERINPGDRINRFETIQKIVSAVDEDTLELVAEFYGSVVERGIYKAPSIKVAEAAKVIENIQRDVNVAVMNELSHIFNKTGIDTNEVLKAASTRWNFLNFRPGLVGGHCVAVDPYYLTYHAESIGYYSRMILTGRAINNDMISYVADNIVKLLVRTGKVIQNSNVAILGVTYKENCSDARYSKVFDLVSELQEYGINISLYDPIADEKHVEKYHNMRLLSEIKKGSVDAVVVAVAHDSFKRLNIEEIGMMYTEGERVIVDIMACLDREEYESAGYLYWSL